MGAGQCCHSEVLDTNLSLPQALHKKTLLHYNMPLKAESCSDIQIINENFQILANLRQQELNAVNIDVQIHIQNRLDSDDKNSTEKKSDPNVKPYIILSETSQSQKPQGHSLMKSPYIGTIDNQESKVTTFKESYLNLLILHINSQEDNHYLLDSIICSSENEESKKLDECTRKKSITNEPEHRSCASSSKESRVVPQFALQCFASLQESVESSQNSILSPKSLMGYNDYNPQKKKRPHSFDIRIQDQKVEKFLSKYQRNKQNNGVNLNMTKISNVYSHEFINKSQLLIIPLLSKNILLNSIFQQRSPKKILIVNKEIGLN